MKQLKHTLFAILFLSAAIFNSCNTILDDADNIPTEQEQIQVGITRAAGTYSGRLLFWTGAYTMTSPWLVEELSDLNAYESTKYNTGEYYPSNNSIVYATGYSPSPSLSSDISTSDNLTLTLPAGRAGFVDVCTAAGIITGSRSTPFSARMEFEHTLTKIHFTVERDPTMEGIRDVKNIILTIPKKYLPTTWTWNGSVYEVDYSEPATTDLTLTHPDIIIGTGKREDFIEGEGIVYLMLPTGNTGKLEDIVVTADILLSSSTGVDRQINETITIPLYDENGDQLTGDALPGEAYTVSFNFKQDSFTLIARAQSWEPGGLIYLPVNP